MTKMSRYFTLALLCLGLSACVAEPREPDIHDDVAVSLAEGDQASAVTVEEIALDDSDSASASLLCPKQDVTMIWTSVSVKHTRQVHDCRNGPPCEVYDVDTYIDESVVCDYSCQGCGPVCQSSGNASSTYPYRPGPNAPSHQGHAVPKPARAADMVYQGEECSPEPLAGDNF